MKHRSLTSITVAASTLCVGLSAAGAGTDGAANSAESGIDIQVPDSKERVDEYWTPERMRAAKPMGKPMLKREVPPEPSEPAQSEE